MNNDMNIRTTELQHEIIEFLPQMPNSAIKDFFVNKINNVIKLAQHELIEIGNIINLKNEHKEIATQLNNILDDIIEVENTKWQELSKIMLCEKINNFLSEVIVLNSQSRPVIFNNETIDKIESIISITKTWLDVEHKFPITNEDNLYTLYKYLSPEEVKNTTLEQLFELYQDMF